MMNYTVINRCRKSFADVRFCPVLLISLLLFLVLGLFSFPLQAANLGDNLAVTVGVGDQQNPCVVALPDKDKWLVIWEDWRDWSGSGANIYGRFVAVKRDNSTGALIAAEGCGSEFPICEADGNQTMPTAAYDGKGHILVAWQDTRGDGSGGFLYYRRIDITGLSNDCSSGISPGSEIPMGYTSIVKRNGDPDQLRSRSLPRAVYDAARDQFWLVWIEGRDALQRIQENVAFSPTGTSQIWSFGDSSYVAYTFLPATGNTISVPEIIRNQSDLPCSVRLISHSYESQDGNIEEIFTYEYFEVVNNVAVASDSTSPETLLVWEGIRGKATLTCKLEDGQYSENMVLDRWENDNSQVHIYGIFDKYIGQNVVHTLKIDTADSGSNYPALAFDAVHRKFLVAWEDRQERAGLSDGVHSKIYGQLLYSGGGLYGVNFPISFQDINGDGLQDENLLQSNQTRPQVAVDSTNQRFFVTWQDARNTQVSLENLDIFGQYVDSEGSLRGNNYAICVAAANQYNPMTVFNPASHCFLTVWKDARNLNDTNSDIYGQLYSLGQPQLVLLNEDDTPLVPPLLDFGTIEEEEDQNYMYSSRRIRLKNTGDVTVKIDYVTSFADPESGFSYVNLPPQLVEQQAGDPSNGTIDLVPGATYELTVKFQPEKADTYIDSFDIVSDTSTLRVNLQGIRVLPQTPPATIKVTPDSKDFGTVAIGSSLSQVFILANTGYVDITIQGLDLPGSGFVVKGIGEGTEIKAGKEVPLLVTFSPDEVRDYNELLRILYDKGGEPSEIKLAGRGTEETPVPGIVVAPDHLDFGPVKLGESESKLFTISNTGNVDITIKGLDLPSAGYQLDGFAVGTVIKAGRDIVALLTYKPTEDHPYVGILRIFFDQDQDFREISLSGEVAEPASGTGITVEPVSGDFGTVNLGESKSLLFTLSNDSDVDIDIVGSDGPSSGFTVSALPTTLKARAQARFLLTFTPTELKAYSGTFRIFYGQGVEATEISLQGSGSDVAPAPGIAVSPDGKDFGAVRIGEIRSEVFTFANTGNVDITVIGLNLPAAGFSLSGLSQGSVIKAGETLSALVSFAPTEDRNYAGILQVYYDHGLAPSQIGLSGRALKPQPGNGIEVDPAKVDFGEVVIGENQSRVITLTNNSGIDVNVLGSNGPSVPFTTAELPKTIRAGETVFLLLTMTPTAPRSYSGSMQIFFDHGVEGVTVDLEGSGVGDYNPLLVPDPEAYDFGEVKLNDTKYFTLTLANDGDAAVRVNQLEVPAGFSVIGLQNVNIEPGQKIFPIVKFTPTQARVYHGVLFAAYRGIADWDTGGGAFQITLDGIGQDDNVVDITPPGDMDFGQVPIGATRSANLVFLNQGNVDVEITAFDLVGSGFNVEGLPATIPAGEALTVVATFTPEGDRAYTSTLRVLYDHGLEPTVIQLRGTGIPPAAGIGIAPAPPGDFETVSLGQSKSLVFTLTNFSDVDAEVVSVDGPGEGFTVSGLPDGIKAGESVSLVITFKPEEARSYSGALLIQYGQGFAATAISLQGSGSDTRISVLPQELNFGFVNLGKEKDSYVTLFNQGTVDIEIANSSISSGFTFTGLPRSVEAGQEVAIKVTFAPREKRQYQGVMRISYDPSLNLPDTVINLAGMGGGDQIEIEPSRFNFGILDLGEISYQTLTVRYPGVQNENQWLVIDKVEEPDGFKVTGLEGAKITQGSQIYPLVRFSPDQARYYNAVIFVTYHGEIRSVYENSEGQLYESEQPSGISGVFQIVVEGQGKGYNQADLKKPGDIDFGNIPVGTTRTANLTFRNNGNVPVEILAVDLPDSSGFKVVGLPGTIPKYGVLNARVEFTPGLDQDYSADLWVIYDQGIDAGAIHLQGRGVLSTAGAVEVADRVDFGSCNIGESRSEILRFLNHSSVAIEISAVDMPEGAFKVSGLPGTIPANGVLEALVEFTPSLEKEYQANLRVIYNLGVVSDEITLSGSGVDVSQPAVQAEPQVIDFGPTALGLTRTESVVLSNTGNVAVAVLGVDLPGGAFKVEGLDSNSTLAEGESRVVVISFVPTVLGDFTSSLRILFDHDLPARTIELRGSGIEAKIEPGAITFPDCEVGEVHSEQVIVTNCSDYDLQFSGLQIDNPAFEVTGAEIGDVIPANGGAVILQVYFSPQESGAFAGNLGLTLVPAQDTVNETSEPGHNYTVTLAGNANAVFSESEHDTFTAASSYRLSASASSSQLGQLYVLLSHDPLSHGEIYALTSDGTLHPFPFQNGSAWQSYWYRKSTFPGNVLDLSRVDLRPLGCSSCQGVSPENNGDEIHFGNIVIRPPSDGVYNNAADFRYMPGTLYIATYVKDPYASAGKPFAFDQGLLEVQTLHINSLAGDWQVTSCYYEQARTHLAQLHITEPGDGSLSAVWPGYNRPQISYGEDEYRLEFSLGSYHYTYRINELTASTFKGSYSCEVNGETVVSGAPFCAVRAGSGQPCELSCSSAASEIGDESVVIASYSGQGETYTTPFTASRPWILKWRSPGFISVELLSADDGSKVDDLVGTSSGEGSAYRRLTGEFTLHVEGGGNGVDWEIVIVPAE